MSPYISDVDANAELDAIGGGNRCIAPRHCGLHFGGAAHRIDDAGELDQ
jgi:hypothetical protein